VRTAPGAIAAPFAWRRPGAGYLLTGRLLYLFGTVLVTMLFNVPRNEALAAVDPASIDAVAHWTRYVSDRRAPRHGSAHDGAPLAGAMAAGARCAAVRRG